MESRVEKALVDRDENSLISGSGGLPVIVVDNFPMLGRSAAYRFIEWVQQNPEGVVSLPTGKTPEYFIKEVTRLKQNWAKPELAAELENAGIDPGVRPRFDGLRFVQIDE